MMNSADCSEQIRLTKDSSTESSPDWGSTTIPTSPPLTDGGGPAVTPPTIAPQQMIDEAISTIQNLDTIPQSLKTSIISLLRQVIDSFNDVNSTSFEGDTTTTTTTTTTATKTATSPNAAQQGDPIPDIGVKLGKPGT